MSKKPPLIPIKEVLQAVDKKDRKWYASLSEERKKAFSPWMIQRYVSSCQGSRKKQFHYIYFTNLLVNKNFMDISKHPELQWLLLTATGTGKVEFHPYIKPPNSRKKKDKISEFLCTIYPDLKSDEVELMLKINSIDDLIDLAKKYGYDDKEIKDIFRK